MHILKDAIGQDIDVGSAVVFAHYSPHFRFDGVGFPMQLGRVTKIARKKFDKTGLELPCLQVCGIGYDSKVNLCPNEVVSVHIDLWFIQSLTKA